MEEIMGGSVTYLMREVPPARRPVLIDLNAQSDTMVIFFTGKHRPDKVDGFNYRSMTAHWPVKKLYVRDVYNLWYHTRYDGIGDGVDALRDFLIQMKRVCAPRRLYMIGGSMGGYAAVLFGALIKAEKVLAFAPQTCLDPIWRIVHSDTFLWKLKQHIYKNPWKSPQYYSLRDVIDTHNPNISVDLHVGANRLDRVHAQHIFGFNNVHVIRHDTNRHDVSRVLKKQGKLEGIIRNFISLT